MFFAYGIDGQMLDALREAFVSQRERIVLVTGAYNLIWTHTNVRKTLEARLAPLRDEGKVRRIGLSTHDRKLAGRLASEGQFDTLMIRYNAAHRGAEIDIFPHLSAHDPAIISYTATRW